MINDGFTESDEFVHPFPPSMTNWNESWLLSYADRDGTPAGLFRIGLLPNQNRAWLWLMTVIDGDWLVTEETRLPCDILETAAGIAFSDADLKFQYEPHKPLHSARFRSTSVSRWASGLRAGQLATVTIDLGIEASGPCFDNELRIETMSSKGIPAGYSGRRFEQSVRVSGSVNIAGKTLTVDGYGQRDRSWGPRRWSTPFTLGDFNSPDLQLWFATGPDPAAGGLGYMVRDGQLDDMTAVTGHLPQEPTAADPAWLRFSSHAFSTVTLDLEYLSPPVYFQIAHAQPPYVHYDYSRRLARGRRSDGRSPMIGWIEPLPVGPPDS